MTENVVAIRSQSASALKEGYQGHYAVIQISLQKPPGVFAPPSAELNAGEETAASLDLLEDEEAKIKKTRKQNVNMYCHNMNRI